MANLNMVVQPGSSGVHGLINAANCGLGGAKFELGDGSDSALVTTHAIYLKPSTSPALAGGAITIQTRPKGGKAVLDGLTGTAVPYVKRFLNGVVGDDSMASTVITGESKILVPSTGDVVVLSVAQITAGQWDIYWRAEEGSG